MKNTSTKITSLVFIVLTFGFATFSQSKSELSLEKSETPYDKINIKFVLDGEPTPGDVGFDNPKSFWQFNYELRFLTKDLMNYKTFTESVNETQAERLKRIKKNNKQHDKAWKKSGILVVKGKVPKTQLFARANREIIISVPLTPEIKDILAKAATTSENPEFRIKLTGKVSTRTNSNLKLKQKLASSYVCPTKIITKDAQHWVTNTCGIYISLMKTNNKIRVASTSRL